MFDKISVDTRIPRRHPEITEEDVRSAWNNAIVYAERTAEGVDPPLFVAVGADNRNRMIEMVAVAGRDTMHIFHAMTPPSKKTLTELGL